MSSPPSDTRSRVLEAAWKLLEENRGQGVRMSDIAKRAGITRQALYLHFATRTELLVATVRYVDEVSDIESRLQAYRAATSGTAMLAEFIIFWAHHMPVVYGIAKALIAVQDTDDAAAKAWQDRMDDSKGGCQQIVTKLNDEGLLKPELTLKNATDVLAMLLSVHNWEYLTVHNGWSASDYVEHMQKLAEHALII